MIALSVVVITLNEERNIARALESVKGLTEDIIVVDSGSADRTVAICEEYGARVFSREWEGYSGAKNFGNLRAAHPWIISLDADEALSEELRESIRQHCVAGIPQNRVFSFNRLANYCGKWIHHSGWYPDRKIRIWNRDFGQWEGTIHEKLVFSGRPEVVHLDGDLFHYTFYTDEEHAKQVDHFTTLSAKELFDAGKNAGLLKLLFSPSVRFLRDYIFRGGYRDGKAGYRICLFASRAVRLKYQKLRQMHATGRH